MRAETSPKVLESRASHTEVPGSLQMVSDRNQRIKTIFHSALEREGVERRAFLDGACAGDEELRQQVEQLMVSHEAADSFIEQPAFPSGAGRLEDDGRRFEARNIGPYKLVSLLGAGGMGEVYRAHDSRLGRTVALKLLPQALSRGEDSVRRFQQEARAASALNHPNILAIYDTGTTDDGLPYVVSELLEGETLRDKLATGAIPVRKSIDIASQTARGLTAAHSKGIVHRDLKPENLFVTKDARVKILDFGIAKLIPQKSVGEKVQTEAPTRMISTDPGMVVGTVGYMSPEQVKGASVDTRSDIFSLGAILYETLAGRRAFQCETHVETMNAILKHDPPELSSTNSQISPAIERLVRRCLEKEPEERFQTASDLAFALDSLSGLQSSGATTTIDSAIPKRADRRKLRDWLGWGIAAVLLVACIALGALYFRRSESRAETMRFSLEVPQNATFSDSLALSPDGRHLAFVITAASGATSLWVRSLDSVDMRELAGTDGAQFPFWSPDSRFIAFFAGNRLKRVERSGGPVQPLADTSAEARGGAWAADGTIIFSPGFTLPLYKIAAAGGQAEPVTKLDESLGVTSHRWPNFLPDGRRFLYFARSSQKAAEGVYAGSVDSQDNKLILNTDLLAAYAPPARGGATGHLLFIRDRALVAQSFDVEKLQLSGEPVVIAENLLTYPGEGGPTAFASFSVSANGHLCYLSGDPSQDQMEWFDRSGKSLGLFGSAGRYYEPGLSPDGKKIAAGRADSDAGDIWIFDVARGTTTRFTFDLAADVSPVWSPDGSRIAFASVRKGHFGIYQKTSSGAGEEELLLQTDFNTFPTSWSPDGRFILYETEDSKNRYDLFVLPMSGGEKPFPYLKTQFNETHSQFSPDGRWVAYVSDESGRPEVYVQSFPTAGGKWQISTGGGDQPQWRRDGKELFYLAADKKLMAVSIKTDTTVEAGTPVPLFVTRGKPTGQTDDKNSYFAVPDGQRFLVINLLHEGNKRPITIALNWSANLKR